jgi:hypothetical protein
LHALPSESSTSIIIDQSDIALDFIPNNKAMKKTQIDFEGKHRGLLDDNISYLVQTKQ